MSKIIVTHCDSFHADEVLAYTMLKTVFPDHKLIRSRNEEVINSADIVVDVGKKYDPLNNRFDHHQENCNETFINNGIPMSSAGMVYKHYGRKFLELKINRLVSNSLYFEFYKKIICEVDAIDNGVRQHKDNKFFISTNFSTIIAFFNGSDSYDHEDQYNRFLKAVQYTEYFISIIIDKINNEDILFDKEYDRIKKLITEKNYVVIDFKCQTWYNCIKHLEKQNPGKKIKGIVYQDENGWRVKSMSSEIYPIKDEKFLRENLKKPEEIVFVHKNFFLAGSLTYETAIEIAEMSFE